MEDQMRQLLAACIDTTPVPAGSLPDIDLYMDQVLALLGEQLNTGPEEKPLTKTMVNNYTKQKLLPKPAGKKYTPEHLKMLVLLQCLKRSLSLEEIRRLLAAEGLAASPEGYDRERVAARYRDFEQVKKSQQELAVLLAEKMAACGAVGDLFGQVVYLANLAGALTLAAETLIASLPEEP